MYKFFYLLFYIFLFYILFSSFLCLVFLFFFTEDGPKCPFNFKSIQIIWVFRAFISRVELSLAILLLIKIYMYICSYDLYISARQRESHKIKQIAAAIRVFRYLHMSASGYRAFITANDKWIYRRTYRHAWPSWHGDIFACTLKRSMRNKYTHTHTPR